MKQFRPKVTILIPVYNGSNYLAEAISSALAQTYENIEVLVINDGSRDGGATEAVAKSFGDKIRYFSKENGGVASALNLGFSQAAGDYVSWLSHDDLYYPEKVSTQIAALEKIPNSENVIMFSDYSIFSDAPDHAQNFRIHGASPETFRYWITHEGALHGCTLLIPKGAVEAMGGFDPKLKHTQDYDLWFRMASKFRFVHVPEVLVNGRRHAEQDSVKKETEARKECNRFLSACISKLTEEEMRRGSGLAVPVAYASTAVTQLERGYRWAALEAMKQCFLRVPKSSPKIWIACAVTLSRGARFTVKPLLKLIPVEAKLRLRRWVSALPDGTPN